jgi:serine/threonine-protein kinase NIM1
MTVANNNNRRDMTGYTINDNGEEPKNSSSQQRLSSYERLTRDLVSNEKYRQEVALGKRIGFYRIRGELGSGNFCQVRMGIHALTRGKFFK